jgi:hypothetical protein
MLIEWAAITTTTVVVLLLVDGAIRLGESRGRGERASARIGPPGPVSAGPVVVAPHAEGQGEAAA